MPSVDITQQLYDYLKNNLVNESIDATIRTLINKDDLLVDESATGGVKDNQSVEHNATNEPKRDTVVGGKEDSTNSGYIR